jgi:hypothetical protein
MAFKTFTPGVLTASDVNTFLMRQAVIVCTSSTRPTSPNEGMTIYETDTDVYRTWTGTAWRIGYSIGAWTSFTPTIAAVSTGWALGNGTATGQYAQVGRVVIGRLRLIFGSTSTYGATDALQINLPVTNGLNEFQQSIGFGQVSDASAGVGHFIHVNRLSQTFRLNAQLVNGTYAQNGVILSTVPITWADSDSIGFSFVYEVN